MLVMYGTFVGQQSLHEQLGSLSYAAVKLFSKYSNLCDHGIWTLLTDRQTDVQRDRRHTVACHNRAIRALHCALTINKQNPWVCFPYEFSMGSPWKTHGSIIPWNNDGKFIWAKTHGFILWDFHLICLFLWGQSLLYQERVKATDFKFGQNNNRVHPYKSQLKLLGKKRSVGASRFCPNFLSALYYLRNR